MIRQVERPRLRADLSVALVGLLACIAVGVPAARLVTREPVCYMNGSTMPRLGVGYRDVVIGDGLSYATSHNLTLLGNGDLRDSSLLKFTTTEANSTREILRITSDGRLIYRGAR